MLDKKYNHLEVEKGKYDTWLKNEYFKSGDKGKDPFCIVIPPPNVTGKLHLGHAWDVTLQDIIIRYKRMDGYDALWLPGMDHAGIATQAKVDKKLSDEGIDPRSMSREEWLKHAWEWKEEYAKNIHDQWKKLGLSLDYSKERFTLDEGLNKAVRHVFVELYKKGLIYRGEKIINWDPKAMTALSTEEVVYKDVKGAFYYLKYFIEDSDEYIEIATTRPETIFGDTAVAVNPEDERYRKLVGKNVIIPIMNKKIPIITDEHADMEFGTGAVKITPAHDPNDFEVGLRHDLERITIMNPDATMNEICGKYNGMTREECRKVLIEDMKKENLLIKVEEMTHSVGHSDRSDVAIEPYLSKQWFVKMRPLADHALEVQSGEGKLNYVPKRYEKTQNHWLEISYDWCISRQLWWGHRIPAWYKGDEVYVGMEAPKEDGWIQDEDVLDTWFSSALWPFSTLGWPEETEEFKRYYPNNVLVTGFDIIFFWVCRMVIQGIEFTGKMPFNECLIHGLIRDKQGRKMSKSLGNGIDPMDVIDTYGADALRFFLTTNSSAGTDLRYDEEKVKSTWNFINKIWNASRFVLMNIEDLKQDDLSNLKIQDKWILDKMNTTIKKVRKHMDKYDFNIVGEILYSFIWEDFCDNYIELSKPTLSDITTKSTLRIVLTNILKMLHPFMPYVTEEIYLMLPGHEKSIMISEYPKYNKEYKFENNIDEVIKDITKIRNVKVENNLNKSTKLTLEVENELKPIYCTALKITDDLLFDEDESEYSKINYKSNNINITFYTSNEITEEEKNKILEEKERLEKSIERRKKLLSNKGYVNNAPKEIVSKEKDNLAKEESELEEIIKKLG